MKSNKGFTLIELLAVIVILAIIALITTPIVLNIINQAKEAANKRSVEAYAKAVEYAVMQFEYDHNGELPSTDADRAKVLENINYANSDVKCKIKVNCDTGKTGAVVLYNCQVGSYTNNYYKYDGSPESTFDGADVDSTNKDAITASSMEACN